MFLTCENYRGTNQRGLFPATAVNGQLPVYRHYILIPPKMAARMLSEIPILESLRYSDPSALGAVWESALRVLVRIMNSDPPIKTNG